MEVSVRPATEEDVPAILDIYNWAVLNTTATFDIESRTLAEQRQWFRETQHPHCIIVAEEGGTVAGWACLRPFRAKAAYRFTAEDSVYVHPQSHGRGIGTALLARLLELARANGFHSVMAGIAEGNPASEALHRRAGFVRIGIEREVGYKFERWLDVGWWQRMLAPPGAPGS